MGNMNGMVSFQRMLGFPLLALCLLVGWGACDLSVVEPPCTRPSQFAVSPIETVELYQAQTFRASASPALPCGSERGAVEWHSRSPEIASVRPIGPGEAEITAIRPGSAEIVVTHPDDGAPWGSVRVRVNLIP